MTKIGSKTINGENQVNPNEVDDVNISPSDVMPGNPANDVPQVEASSSSVQGPAGADGEDGVGISDISLTSTDGLTDTYTITYTDSSTSIFTVTNGADGTEVEIQKGTDYIQWRYVGDASWQNLVALTEITGPKGDKGDAPDLRTNGNQLEYSKDGGSTWNSLYDLTQLQGDTGNGVDSITWKSNSEGSSQGTPGTTDTYEILYTDGTTTTFTVANGTNATDGLGISDISRTSGDGSPGTTDTYTVTYTDDSTYTFDIYNGADGTNGSDGSDGYALISINTTSTIDDTLFQNNAGRSPMNGDAILNTNNGNNILYVRESGSWIDKGTINGSDGSDGSAGTDGNDGDKWHYGTAGASSDVGTTVQDYDEYYINTDTKQVYYKASGSGTWNQIFIMNGSVYKATVSKSIDLSTLSIGDSLSITKSGLSYSKGQFITVAYSSAEYIIGRVDGYSSDTINLTVLDITGSGSHSSWTLNLSAKPNLNESKRGASYEIFLPAADGSVSGRIGDASASFPEGWSGSDSSGDIVISHNVTDGDGNYRPSFIAEVMYLRTSDSKWVTLQGTAAYSSKENDLNTGEVQLNSLTTNEVDIKIHLLFY